MNDDTDIVTKQSTDDYNAFLILTKLEYEAGLIKEESLSELLIFTIRIPPSSTLTNQLHIIVIIC